MQLKCHKQKTKCWLWQSPAQCDLETQDRTESLIIRPSISLANQIDTWLQYHEKDVVRITVMDGDDKKMLWMKEGEIRGCVLYGGLLEELKDERSEVEYVALTGPSFMVELF